jgi:exopolysaccharide biosynthesis polyprenyl glycosylphosphotransferase
MDLLLGALAFVAVLALAGPGAPLPTHADSLKAIVLVLIASLVWPLALQSTVVERATRQVPIASLLTRLCTAAAAAAVLVSATAFTLGASLPPRLLLACVVAQLVAVSLFRVSILGWLRLARRRGRDVRNLLIAGSGPLARAVQRRVEQHPEWGYAMVGFVDEGGCPIDPAIPAEQVHKFVELPQLMRDHVIDEVVIACPRSLFGELGSIVGVCAEAGVPVTVLSDILGDYFPPPRLTQFDTLAALRFSPVHHDVMGLLLKRGGDLILAGAALLISAPVLAVATVAIKATSPGPVFFHQERCGRNGHRFGMLKLRTMVRDAEERQADLLDRNEMDGPVFKIETDPRVTPVGHVLRRWSIDELPQLWNVLRGDMSLVGPRPPIPAEVARYRTFERRRLSMRPGITCLWQVNGRNQIGFDEWVKLDVEYIDTWSLANDLKILLRTIPAVLRGTGS